MQSCREQWRALGDEGPWRALGNEGPWRVLGDERVKEHYLLTPFPAPAAIESFLLWGSPEVNIVIAMITIGGSHKANYKFKQKIPFGLLGIHK